MLLFGSEAMWNFKFAFIPGITPITGEVCRCAGVIRTLDAHAFSQQWMGMMVMDPICDSFLRCDAKEKPFSIPNREEAINQQ